MPTKPVSLSVHRNTIESRRKRELARECKRSVERLIAECDIRAYAIVGIAADGEPHALWDTGAILPMWAFPEIVAATLRESILQSVGEGLKDDWRPGIREGATLNVAGATSRPKGSTS